MSSLQANSSTVITTKAARLFVNGALIADNKITVGNTVFSNAGFRVGSNVYSTTNSTAVAFVTQKMFIGGRELGIPFGGIVNYQEFTANGTWYNPYANATVNANMTNTEQAIVMVWGAGGTGDSIDNVGGGGGACIVSILPLSSFTTTCAVTVGAGNATNGGNGGNSSMVVNSSVTIIGYGGTGAPLGNIGGGGGGAGVLGMGSSLTGGAPLPGSTSTYGGGTGAGTAGTSIFGGGGGGDGNGGGAIFGGGGGSNGTRGTSVLAGSGGDTTDLAQTPGGGGGSVAGTRTGARGEVRVWVIGNNT